ncbi:MAG TPA: hypothetical protein VEL81_02260 [Thermoplasmata archaeon]|nr:hypothetical protein [Thermoplasmata archaeon]
MKNGQTYNFAGWSGDMTSNQPTLTINAYHPVTVRANWTVAGPVGISSVGCGLIALFVVVALVVVVLVWRRRRGGDDG